MLITYTLWIIAILRLETKVQSFIISPLLGGKDYCVLSKKAGLNTVLLHTPSEIQDGLKLSTKIIEASLKKPQLCIKTSKG